MGQMGDRIVLILINYYQIRAQSHMHVQVEGYRNVAPICMCNDIYLSMHVTVFTALSRFINITD